MNPVVISVCVMLILALMRVNVVVALTFSAIIGGVVSGMSLNEAVSAFEGGLGGGATIALSYAMLGAFAVAISKSGLTDLLAQSVIKKINGKENQAASTGLKYLVLIALILVTVSSQNVIPVHIAFIPILIPPLLGVFAKLKLDRRLIACVLTFGLVTPYMLLPIGFGGIFLNNILLKNLQDNGLTEVVASQVPTAMMIPAAGMIFGLLTAMFFSYRKPREYKETELTVVHEEMSAVKPKNIAVAIAGIVAALAVQLSTGSMIIGALAGFMVFTFGGVIKWSETQDVFTKGVHMMAMIGFIMISGGWICSSNEIDWWR